MRTCKRCGVSIPEIDYNNRINEFCSRCRYIEKELDVQRPEKKEEPEEKEKEKHPFGIGYTYLCIVVIVFIVVLGIISYESPKLARQLAIGGVCIYFILYYFSERKK